MGVSPSMRQHPSLMAPRALTLVLRERRNRRKSNAATCTEPLLELLTRAARCSTPDIGRTRRAAVRARANAERPRFALACWRARFAVVVALDRSQRAALAARASTHRRNECTTGQRRNGSASSPATASVTKRSWRSESISRANRLGRDDHGLFSFVVVRALLGRCSRAAIN